MTPSQTRGRWLALATALAAAGMLLSGASVWSAPYVPPSADTVLERLPVRNGPITALDRRDPEAAVDAAGRFLARGQTLQDPRHVGYARAALQPWWSDAAAPVDVVLLRAAIRQNRHEFDAALADFDLVLRRSPHEPRAWTGRAAVLLVLGRPGEALAACGEADRRAASIAGTVCRAGAMARLGQAEAAYVLLDATLARSMGLEPTIERWARTELAEIARLSGRTERAEAELRNVLSTEPADAFAATTLADLLVDGGRAADALAVLRGDLAHDGKLLRAALAERRLGDPAWADHAAWLEERFAAARRRGDALHLREEARFRLELRGDPMGALALAEANWRTQREPPDARILLEAARAAGSPDAAAPVLAWLRETGLKDPQLEGASG